MRGIRSIATTIVLVGTAYAATAAEHSSREAFFRCKDRNGQTHYGDSMPAECAGLDTEVLNDRGMQVRLIEGEATRLKRLEREEAEAKVRKEKADSALRDRTLIETYLTVEDIERLRNQRLDQLNAQYRVTEQNIANLRERQTRLEAQIARFKPYSDNPSAPALPEHLAAELVSSVNGMRVYEESLASNRKEQAQLNEQFDADVKRFKELKGLR
ncbi:MAG TPA: hypothetical protein VJT80_18705 [Steroidobacteraceae bacterium]|nr:hypothetical protein [Steroidobacteraceae bacterium]